MQANMDFNFKLGYDCRISVGFANRQLCYSSGVRGVLSDRYDKTIRRIYPEKSFNQHNKIGVLSPDESHEQRRSASRRLIPMFHLLS